MWVYQHWWRHKHACPCPLQAVLNSGYPPPDSPFKTTVTLSLTPRYVHIFMRRVHSCFGCLLQIFYAHPLKTSLVNLIMQYSWKLPKKLEGVTTEKRFNQFGPALVEVSKMGNVKLNYPEYFLRNASDGQRWVLGQQIMHQRWARVGGR